jgi:Holliday junction resolvase
MNRYAKGRKFEYKVRDELLRLGLVVFRTARSSGKPRNPTADYPPVDLIAFRKSDGKAVFIECKSRGWGRISGNPSALPGRYFIVTPRNLSQVLGVIQEWATRG